MDTKLISQIQNIISNPVADEMEVIHHLKKIIFEAEVAEVSVSESKSISELFTENIRSLDGEGNNYNVIKTGYTDLDKLIGGFAPGELVVIGARPSMGKTQLLVNLCIRIARENPVLYFTFDLSDYLLTCRFMSALSNIGVDKILQQDLTEEEKILLKSLEKEIGELKIDIHDSYNNSVSLFKDHCIKQIKEKGVKVIVVDYLQMMSSNRYRNNREMEVSHISLELKNLAKDYNICVIATSQLSRAVELRSGNKRPYLSDLRDSGSIEQNADKVFFIHRPEVFGIDVDEDGNSTSGIAEIIVAKNRNGKTGSINLKIDYNFANFSDFIGYKTEFSFSAERLNEIDKPF